MVYRMTSKSPIMRKSKANRAFAFESYGVLVKIESNHQELVDKAELVSKKALLGNLTSYDGVEFDHVFELPRDDSGVFHLIQNGEQISYGEDETIFFKFFDSILRVAIGEYATDRVFLHAGVVGWKGKAIVLPADSYQGKSTLVAELVKIGAEYYSDEFAILDQKGFVHPFPRRLNLRTEDYKTYDLSVEDLGGTYGKGPLPVGLILLTGYRPGEKWQPEILSSGNGLLKIIPFTLSIRYRPKFAMEVLHNVSRHAIIASSLRGSADKFAKTLLEFVDNNVI